MSVMFALLLAAAPTAAPAEAAPAKKPRLKCEWIHEVGSSRPRRICEKPAPKPADAAQAAEAAEKSGDHKDHGSSDR